MIIADFKTAVQSGMEFRPLLNVNLKYRVSACGQCVEKYTQSDDSWSTARIDLKYLVGAEFIIVQPQRILTKEELEKAFFAAYHKAEEKGRKEEHFDIFIKMLGYY